MESRDGNKCAVCGRERGESTGSSLFAEAGEWLAADIWKDAGTLCQKCLENRGRLAMMYLREKGG